MTIRREEEADDVPASFAPEAGSAMRPRLPSRPAISVDEVGDAAVSLARGRRASAPALLASKAEIAKAPIDSRAAFVLSLVDGHTPASAIVDTAGLPEDEVHGILERLAKLGLISVR